MAYLSNQILGEFSGTEDDFKELVEALFKHRSEFDEFVKEGSKLQAVKYLKELTGAGLKNSKEVCDLYWDGKLKGFHIREDRKAKIERLAKVPLVEQLIDKLKNLEEEKLHSLLMSLEIDLLLSIDDFFINE